MYEHYNKMKEVLDKIKVEADGDLTEGEVDAKITGYITTEDVHDLCQGIAELNPSHGKEAFFLLLGELDSGTLWKIHILLDRFAHSDKVEIMQRVACELTLKVFNRVLTIPCQIAGAAEEMGHLEGCEEVLGFYITQDELEEIHDKTHEVMAMVGSTEHMGGSVHQIHQN